MAPIHAHSFLLFVRKKEIMLCNNFFPQSFVSPSSRWYSGFLLCHHAGRRPQKRDQNSLPALLSLKELGNSTFFAGWLGLKPPPLHSEPGHFLSPPRRRLKNPPPSFSFTVSKNMTGFNYQKRQPEKVESSFGPKKFSNYQRHTQKLFFLFSANLVHWGEILKYQLHFAFFLIFPTLLTGATWAFFLECA